MITYHKGNGSERSVWYAQKVLQGHFFRNEQISKERTYKFCEIFDNEGTTQLLLRSDNFMNPTF